MPSVAERRIDARHAARPRRSARVTPTVTAGVLLGVAALLVGRAGAQPASAPTPVDPGISDADPRATSLKRMEEGNAQFNFETRLRPVDRRVGWTPGSSPAVDTGGAAPWRDPATGLLHHQSTRYRAPGVRALVDRPQYLTLLENGVPVPDAPRVAVIGANTVFELTPEPTAAAVAAARRPEPYVAAPGQLDTRLNLRMTGPDPTRRSVNDAGAVRGRQNATVPGPRVWRRVRNGPAGGPGPEAPVPMKHGTAADEAGLKASDTREATSLDATDAPDVEPVSPSAERVDEDPGT